MVRQMRIAFESHPFYNDIMNTVGTIAFKLQQKVDGEEVTPSKKKLRNTRLIDVVASQTYYDEDELNRAIEKGTKAWADVPNISEWVAEQRGASYA
jgi:hypothetical protein